jgi:hypothetical protein|tara:strand:+ start:446 stop:1144 length:699 start_codon:yes stop_codon:yes gene_type:complete
MSIQFEFKKHSYKEVASYFKKEKLKNLILFSQARSGSTFATENFPKFLNFKDEQIFNEANFLNKHFSYLKYFIKKHDNFFLNTNEFVYRRTELIKEDTLFVYLYRDHKDIEKSYEKAIKKNFYMGWNEFYSRYKILFPEIDQSLHVSLFNHFIWQKQISKFRHALTLDFNSFKDLDSFLIDRSNFVTLKQQKSSKIFNRAKKNPNINFNIFEKFYFFCIRKLESRKKNIINY